MSFLGLGPKANFADAEDIDARVVSQKKKKKKKKIRKVRRAATAPAETPDSADESSRVFIKRKPAPKNGEFSICCFIHVLLIS